MAKKELSALERLTARYSDLDKQDGELSALERLERGYTYLIPEDERADYGPPELETAATAPVQRETSIAEFAQGVGLQGLRGTIGASEALASQGDLAARGLIPGYNALVPRTAAQKVIGDIYEPGKEAATELMPDAYRAELERDIVLTNENDEITGFQMPTGEQVVGTIAESAAYIPQLLAGGGAISSGLQGVARKGMADFVGYGAANTATVAPTQGIETFRNVYEEARASGLNETEAYKAASEASQSVEKEVGALSFLTGGAGLALASRLGGAAATRLGGATKGFLADAPLEAIEEGGQAAITDFREGRDFNVGRTANAAALGAIAGGIPGAAVGFTSKTNAAPSIDQSVEETIEQLPDGPEKEGAQLAQEIAAQAEAEVQSMLGKSIYPKISKTLDLPKDAKATEIDLGQVVEMSTDTLPSIKPVEDRAADVEVIDDLTGFSETPVRDTTARDAQLQELAVRRDYEQKVIAQQESNVANPQLSEGGRKRAQNKLIQAQGRLEKIKQLETELTGFVPEAQTDTELTLNNAPVASTKAVAPLAPVAATPVPAVTPEAAVAPEIASESDLERQLTPEEDAALRSELDNDPEIGPILRELDTQYTSGTRTPDAPQLLKNLSPDIKRLYDNGTVRIVKEDDAKVVELIEKGSLSSDGRGFFDGKNIYIRADKVKPEEANAVALHEVKHFMDRKAGSVKKRSLKSILGDEGNVRVVSRIEQLAKSGNKVAQTALARANATEMRNDEMPAYFIEEAAIAAQSGTIGRAGAVIRDIISMAKAKLADFGLDLNLSENDIYYLGRQLAKEAGKTSEAKAQRIEPTLESQAAPMFRFNEPGRNLRGKVGNSTISYAMNDKGEANLNLIRTPPEHRGKGEARKALRSFLREADNNRVPVTLTVAEQSADTDGARLQEFYESEGFKVVGKARDGSPKMRREASVVLESAARKEVTNTPEFKEWFGDSKVVDENGEPLVVYHGTRSSKLINQFSESAVGSQTDPGFMGSGFYFGDSRDASAYAGYFPLSGIEHQPSGGSVYPAYLSLQSPLQLYGRMEGRRMRDRGVLAREAVGLPRSATATELRAKLEGAGYDGVIYKDDLGTTEYVAFRPEQIKSAVGNKGAFDKTSPNILESRPKAVAADKVVEKKVGEKQQAKRASPPTPTGASAVIPKSGVPDVFNKQNAKTVRKGRDPLIKVLGKKLYGMADFALAGDRGVAPLTEALDTRKNRDQLAKVLVTNAAVITRKAVNRLPEAHRARVNELISKAHTPAKPAKIGKGLPSLAKQKAANQADADAIRKRARMLLSKDYPEVFEGVMKFRNAIDKATATLIAEMLSTGKPLTVDDANKIRTMRERLESYLTTEYATTSGSKVSKRHLEVMTTEYRKWKEALKKDPNAQPSADAQIYQDALDFVRGADVEIGSVIERATLEGDEVPMPLEKLEAIHAMWVSPTESSAKKIEGGTIPEQNAYRDQLIQELQDKREELEKSGQYDELASVNADKIVLSILGGMSNAPSFFAQHYRGAGGSRGILKDKGNVPEPIRKLMGELVEPILVLERTLLKQHELINTMRLQRDLYEIGYGKYFVYPSEGTADKFTDELKGESLGMLQGMVAVPEAALVLNTFADQQRGVTEALQLAFSQVNAGEGIKKAVTTAMDIAHVTAGYYKAATIIGNSSWRIPLNLVSGPFTLAQNGHLAVTPAVIKAQARAAKAAAELVRPESGKELSQDAQDLIRYGLVESAQVATLQQMFYEGTRQEILQGKASRVDTARTSLSKALEPFTNIYGHSDQMGRWPSFFLEIDLQKKLADARGENISLDNIKRAAANKVLYTNITFARASTVAKMMEYPGISTFATYFWEQYRSIFASQLQGAKDVIYGLREGGESGKMLALSGVKRLAGSTAVLVANRALFDALARIGIGIGGYGLINKIMDMFLELDDEEEKERTALQEAGAIMYPGSTLIYIGRNAEGHPIFFSADEMFAIGPSRELLQTVIEAYQNPNERMLERLWEKALSNWFGNQFNKRVAQLVLGSPAADRPTMATTRPYLYEASKQLMTDVTSGLPVDGKNVDQSLRLTESMIPTGLEETLNILLRGAKTGKGFEGVPDYFQALGGPPFNFKPDSVKMTLSMEYGKKIDEMRDQLRPSFKGVDLPPERIQQMYNDAYLKELEIVERFRPLVATSRQYIFGETKDRKKQLENDKALKEAITNRGISVAQWDNLTGDKFNPTVFTQKMIDGNKKLEKDELKPVKFATEALRKKAEAEIDARWKRVEEQIEIVNLRKGKKE